MNLALQVPCAAAHLEHDSWKQQREVKKYNELLFVTSLFHDFPSQNDERSRKITNRFCTYVYKCLHVLAIHPTAALWSSRCVLFSCVTEGADGIVLPNCSTIGTTLATADTSVAVSCTSLVFSNVVVQGNMTLNISIAGIVAANPSAPNIMVTISNMTLQAGATLAFDSNGNVAGGPKALIMIQSLIGSDGCLVFLGSFPPGTSILVSGAQMTSSTSSAPTLSSLDPYYPTDHKMVMLVSLSLAGNASLIFANSSLVASNGSIVIHPVYTASNAPMTFSSGSALVLQNCSLMTRNGTAALFWSPASFASSSYMSLRLCNMTGGHGFYTASLVSFSSSSYITARSCNLTAVAAAGHAFYMASDTFRNSSYLALTSCTMIGGDGGGSAFYVTSAAFTSSSYLSMGSCILTTAGGAGFAAAMYSAAFSNASFVTLISCSITGAGGDALYMSSPVTFSRSSYFAVSSCTLTAGGGGGSGNAFYLASAAFSSSSYLNVSSCILTAAAGGGSAFYVARAAVNSSSYFAFFSCTFTAPATGGAYGYAFKMDIAATFANSSYLAFSSCTIALTGSGGIAFVISSPISFTNSSYLALRFCDITSGGGTGGSGYAIYVSAATFTNSSYLNLDTCNITAGGAGVDAFHMASTASFISSSYLEVISCTITAGGGGGYGYAYKMGIAVFSSSSYLAVRSSLLSAGRGNSAFFLASAVSFTNSSYLALDFCNVTSGGGGGSALYIFKPVSFASSSYLAVSSCNMTSVGGYALYMISASFASSSYMMLHSCLLLGSSNALFVGAMSVNDWSYLVVTKCSFLSSASSPSVTLGGTSALIVGNSSWLLWRGNSMRSALGNKNTCIQGSINVSVTSSVTPGGTFAIVDNVCTCDPGCLLWNASNVTVGGGINMYQRCNMINGAFVPTGSSLMPTGTIKAGACGLCNASADCFGPLTTSNSTCSVNASSAVTSPVCQCSSMAVASNKCQPWGFLISVRTFSASGELSKSITATISAEPSRSCTISRSGTTYLTRSTSGSTSISSTVWPTPSPSHRFTFRSFPQSRLFSGSRSRSISASCTTRPTTSATHRLRFSSFPSVATSSSGTLSKSTGASFFPPDAHGNTLPRSSEISATIATVTLTPRSYSASLLLAAEASNATRPQPTNFPITGTPAPSGTSFGFLPTTMPTSVSTTTPPTAAPTVVCELIPPVVLRNTTALTFSTGAVTSPFGGSNNSASPVEKVVTASAGETLPMASVLAAAGSKLRITLAATAGYLFAYPTNMSVSFGIVVRAVSYSTNITVDISVANVQVGKLSASSITRFVVSVGAVVSPPLGSPCPPGNVTLVFECFFSPLRISAALKTAVDTTYRTSTALSSALGNPVTAMSNTGMVSILTLEECVFSDVDPLDASVSPIPFAVGDEVGQYYRGGVLLSTAVYVGYFLLILLSLSVVPLISSMTRNDVLTVLKYPSSVMIFAGMFHQGMVSSSVSLLRLGNSSLDMLLGSCGVVAATGLTIFMLLAGTRWRQCHVADRSEDETHSNARALQLFLRLALWKQHWVDDVRENGVPSGYKRRYLFILDDMASGYWAAVELTSGLAQGSILGVRENDAQVCQIQRLVLLAHCFLMAVASLIVRPCGSLFGNFFLFVAKLGSFLVSLLIVIHTVSGSEEAHADAELVTASFVFVSTLQTAIQVLLVLVLSRKSLLKMIQSLFCRILEAPPEDRQNIQQVMILEKDPLLLGDECSLEAIALEEEFPKLEVEEEKPMMSNADQCRDMGERDQLDFGSEQEESETDDAANYERKRQEVLKFIQQGYSGFWGRHGHE